MHAWNCQAFAPAYPHRLHAYGKTDFESIEAKPALRGAFNEIEILLWQHDNLFTFLMLHALFFGYLLSLNAMGASPS